MRILVLGANGQVGHELLRVLASGVHEPNPHPPLPGTLSRGEREKAVNPSPARSGQLLNPSPSGRGAGVRVRDCEIIPATRSGTLADGASCERIDIADLERLVAALDRISPDVIINAAAYTAVDRAEDEPDLAQRVNADAVGVLGAWVARYAARVVHFSTDYVFDGNASRPYREDDPTHPLGVYGRSKLAGEVALRDSGARHLIFRTAWVYAARGHNFLRTMLRLGAERDELRVVDDQIGAPTPARLIAVATALAIVRWHGGEPGASATFDGTYHLVAGGQVSWCGFARAIFDRAVAAGLLESAPRVAPITTAEYPTKATRPAYSVLDSAKLQAALDVRLPAWQTALDGVIGELAGSGALRRQGS